MSQRVRGLQCACAFGLAAAVLAGGAIQAQRTTKGDAEVMLLDPKGRPVRSSLMKVRDEYGRVLVPEVRSQGVLVFRGVGPKLVIDFGMRGPKARPIEIELIDAPLVFVSVEADPLTARVKHVLQKPLYPDRDHTDRIRGFPSRGGTRLIRPTNNDCANATPITDGSTPFTTVNATTDGIQPPSCGAPSNISNDIWFAYVATATGVVTIETCGTASFDTKVAVYLGTTCPTGLPIWCNDDTAGCTGLTSRATAPVVAGNPYLIRVGSFDPNGTGTGTITITPPAAPGAFDHRATAPEVDGNTTTMFDNSGGTTDASDPGFGCRFGGSAQGFGTSWFRFVATDTQATISTDGSLAGSLTRDTLLAVYSGASGALVELGCNDDISINPGALNRLSKVTVGGLKVGQTYFIQVAGTSLGDLGMNNLDLVLSAPQGDACNDPMPGVCGGDPVTVNLANMSTDPTDPAFTCRFDGPGKGFGTAWITFMAAETSVSIDTNASTGASDTLLALYDGACGALTQLSCSEDEGVGLFSQLFYDGLTVGNMYTIQVAGYDTFSLGDATVTIKCPANDVCAGAIPIALASGGMTTVHFDTTEATHDIDMPCPAFLNGGPWRNVWFSVTGTGNEITATTCNPGTSHPDTKISVYSGGCDSASQVCVVANDNAPCGNINLSTATWCSELGVEYLVTVGGSGPNVQFRGPVELVVSDGGISCIIGPDPKGACCLTNGTCVFVTLGECAAMGGSYQGNSTVCFPNPVADGSFEAGLFSGKWIESSTNFGTPLCDGSCGFGGGMGPRTGDFWAWFGGLPGFEEGSLSQVVTIPVGATKLDFYLEIPAASGNMSDFLEVKIDGMQVFVTLESAGPHAYQLVSIPLGTFADGGHHTIEFHSICTALTNFFVDDVSLDATVPICALPGACCLPDGSCAVLAEGDCTTQGGTYLGDGTACVGNAVTQGGFENGPLAGSWVESSINYPTPVCDLASCGNSGGTGPRTGTYWAYFGGTSLPEEAAVQQSVTIPVGATLDFYLEIPTSSGSAGDFLEVTIDGVQVFAVTGSDGPFVGYELVSIPLGPFANGASHVLRFHSVTSAARGFVVADTRFFVDDISIGACQ